MKEHLDITNKVVFTIEKNKCLYIAGKWVYLNEFK